VHQPGECTEIGSPADSRSGASNARAQLAIGLGLSRPGDRVHKGEVIEPDRVLDYLDAPDKLCERPIDRDKGMLDRLLLTRLGIDIGGRNRPTDDW
jgi:hypothetical protein